MLSQQFINSFFTNPGQLVHTPISNLKKSLLLRIFLTRLLELSAPSE